MCQGKLVQAEQSSLGKLMTTVQESGKRRKRAKKGWCLAHTGLDMLAGPVRENSITYSV